MKKTLTYLDANVIIAAYAAKPEISSVAMAILQDQYRELLVSEALWLELFPKPIYFQRSIEIAFYEEIFAFAVQRLPWDAGIISLSKQLASRYGLAAMDAVHIASAIVGGADVFITGEKATKPIFKVREIPVISIHTVHESLKTV